MPKCYQLLLSLVLFPLIVVSDPSLAKTKKTMRVPKDFAGKVCRAQDTDKMMCMVCNIYFEARGETHIGKVAVGRTILTRITRRQYPDSICGVVWQSGQFSWTNDHRANRLPGVGSHDFLTLADSVKAANDVFRLGPNGLANFCNPRKSSCPWRNTPKCIATKRRIGRHLFCETA